MARAPNEKIEQAYNLYLQGEKLVDIAAKLDVPAGTIRRWKSTHNWDGERSDKKSERSDKKITENDFENEDCELTEKQKIFCHYYVKNFNATKAYQKSYGVTYFVAAANGSRMLKNAKVNEYIKTLKQNRLNRELLDEDDIFQKYIDIAFADITDFITFGREKVKVYNERTKKDEEIEINTVKFRESAAVDGTLINEVKHGKDGPYIKLADRMKALDWLSAHMDLATAEQRAKIKALEAKIVTPEDDEANIESFLKAIAPGADTVAEVFDDEQNER